MRTIEIAGRRIGAACPAFVVAEIGINHNGDMDLAKRTIDAAIRAGADSVKFQTYRTEDFVNDRSLTYTYGTNGSTVTESQYEMFKRCELDDERTAELKAYCDRAGVIFHATPTSPEGVEFLARLGVPVLKNGSDELTNLPLVEAMARSGIATVLSTGMATLAEIDDAVRAFRVRGGAGLVLLHCTSSYPAPPEHVHLPKIATLASAFDVPAGFSDHTAGTAASVAAVALGACWIEKHFTLDRTLPGPDHAFSSDEREFARLVRDIRVAEATLAPAPLGPAGIEEHSRTAYRMSCVAVRPLSRGDVVQPRDVAFRRPGTGLAPKMLDAIVGLRLARDVASDHAFTLRDFAETL